MIASQLIDTTAPLIKGDKFFLRVEGLCKQYLEGEKTRKVLVEANLSAARGEITAILGKSGSGKTTLLNLISGIDRVDCGEVYLGNLRLTGMNEVDRTYFRRESIGFIFQFFNLIPTLSVWENVFLPLELNRRTSASDKEHARRLLAEVGLAGREKTFPDRLSGGEQQRVAIARALAHDPLLVLADEPTGNLDDETGVQVLTLLERLTRAAGKNMILVTHSEDAASIADHIYVLREGHLSSRSDIEKAQEK
jgi:putative ABC transport system ATP-binding protein